MQAEMTADVDKLIRNIILLLSLDSKDLSDTERELLTKIIKSPRGTILRRGKVERTLWGITPGMIIYKTRRSKRTSVGESVPIFLKWAAKAEFIEAAHS